MEKDISRHNTLNFGIPGDKIQHVLWRIQNLDFSNNSSIKCIFILSGTNNFDYNPPEELVNGIILSRVSAKKQCSNATVILISLLSRGKKDSIRRGNINIINKLLEEKSGKHVLYILKHNKSWLNVDQSLNMDLFYEEGLHLMKKGNEPLAKEIMVFYKKLSSTVYNTPHISYKNMASFSYNTDEFPTLQSNGTSSQLTSVYIPVKLQERNSRLYPFLTRLIPYCLRKMCLYVLLKRICFLLNQMIFSGLILGPLPQNQRRPNGAVLHWSNYLEQIS